MNEFDKSLIAECEKTGNDIAEQFINKIDNMTNNFDEYRFAYLLAFDTLRKYLERSAP